MKLLDKEILYCDNHLLVLDKPPGLLSLPSKKESDSARERGKETLKELYKKPGEVFLHPVHRLDRLASGILVLARTSKALARLSEQLKTDQWQKTYYLRYEGELPALEGTLKHTLLRGEYRTSVVKEGVEGGQIALLHYRKRKKQVAEVQLVTGRYHQIRAQFSHIGCPVAGDTKYGAQTKPYSPGIDLHHAQLLFTHPVTKEVLTFSSPPPFPI